MTGIVNIDPRTYGHGELADECAALGYILGAYVLPVAEGESHVHLHAMALATKMGYQAIYPVAEALIHGSKTSTEGPRAKCAEAWIRKCINGELNT